MVSAALSEILESVSDRPGKETHFWVRPGTGDVVAGAQVHSDLVELHWERMGLPEDHTHSMFDAIAHGWTRVRITAETAIIQANSLRDARRVLACLLDATSVCERPVTVSIEETRTLWHKTLTKWVAVADLAKTQSFQLRGFDDAERFARGVTRIGDPAEAW